MKRRHLAGVALLFLVFGTGPTVGDVGGCGATPTELDEPLFARSRKVTDCKRCTECGLHTDRCASACNEAVPGEVKFPSTCRPLLHDAEVCIHALGVASCADYAMYVDDVVASVPSECDFCRVATAPVPTLREAPEGGL